MEEETRGTDEGGVRGVYTISDIDTFSFGDIERTKNKILTELDELDVKTAGARLHNLFVLMQTLLEKYFSRETIEKQRVFAEGGKKDGYNFYDLIELVGKTENMNVLRRIIEFAYIDYNKLVKPLVSLPTVRSDWRKKLVARLFSVVPKKDPEAFFDDIWKSYKATGVGDNTLNFFSYCVSQMAHYDLDFHGIKVGFARTGKSTLCLQEYRRKYAFDLGTRDLHVADEHMINMGFVTKNIAFSKKQNIPDMFKKLNFGDGFLIDEGYLGGGDRRESIDKGTIKITQTMNFYASKDAVVNTNIQNITDLERRFFAKANAITVIVGRGLGLVFAGSKNFPLIKDLYGFEKFFDTPSLLSDFGTGVYRLKGLPSYVCDISWDAMDECGNCGHVKHPRNMCPCGCQLYSIKNKLFARYIAQKTMFQAKPEEVEEEKPRGRPKSELL